MDTMMDAPKIWKGQNEQLNKRCDEMIERNEEIKQHNNELKE